MYMTNLSYLLCKFSSHSNKSDVERYKSNIEWVILNQFRIPRTSIQAALERMVSSVCERALLNLEISLSFITNEFLSQESPQMKSQFKVTLKNSAVS
jgi:hypothetical protein